MSVLNYSLPVLGVEQFLADCNFLLSQTYEAVSIVGEVANFKISQGRWVFFDLKERESSVGCFMPVSTLRMPIEDGMKVEVRANAGLTRWGKFSLTVKTVKLTGEGDLKKSFEILKAKLTAEGLFATERKRAISRDWRKIGVISSMDAAGYADFVKILNARWGGGEVQVAHTMVQGERAADQMIRALQYFNEQAEVEMIVLVRGGGSADDLACFNDEKLVRVIASSRIPVVVGVGHEIDHTLAELAADLAASTPSNTAELISRDRASERTLVRAQREGVERVVLRAIEEARNELVRGRDTVARIIWQEIDLRVKELAMKQAMIRALDPELVLRQGYAMIVGELNPGNVVKITTMREEVLAEVKERKRRKCHKITKKEYK